MPPLALLSRAGRNQTRRIDGLRGAHRSELILHAAEGGMLPVLDLNPAIESTAAVVALAVLRDQPLQPHQAGVAKQIRPDLALFEGAR